MAAGYRDQASSATLPFSTPAPTRAPQGLNDSVQDEFISVTRDPNSPICVRGLSGPNEVSLHRSSLKESPVQAWFDTTGQFVILETPGQRAQVWDAATGLPVTPTFASRYANSEAEYRTVKLPGDSGPRTTDHRPRTSELNSTLRPPPSDFRLLAELLAGSRLDGTGGWQPLELGEIRVRWNQLQLLSIAKKGKQ